MAAAGRSSLHANGRKVSFAMGPTSTGETVINPAEGKTIVDAALSIDGHPIAAPAKEVKVPERGDTPGATPAGADDETTDGL